MRLGSLPYLTAPLWLLFLLLGMLISLQARFVRPEYFPNGFSLFPTWPARDPVLAVWVLVELRESPELLAFHVAQLQPPHAARPDTVDVNLAVGRARVDVSETFEESAAHLSSREVFSTLKDRSALSAVLQKQ